MCFGFAFGTTASVPEALQIPYVIPSRPEQFSRRLTRVLPVFNTCRDYFAPPRGWRLVSEIISVANKSFERRGWSKAFLAERKWLAWLFRDRSEYVLLRRPGSRREPVAAIGHTWVEYTRNSAPDPRKQLSEDEVSVALPGEISINSKPFPRLFDQSGKGIVFEIRAWAIDKESLDSTERAEAFAHLYTGLIPLIFARLQPYPELYDKPIIYTYGDEASLKLYGAMGFRKLSKDPIQHEGSNWWILAISPKEIEAFTRRLKSPQSLYGLNQDFEVSLPQGKFAVQSLNGSGRQGGVSRNPLDGSTTIDYLAANATVAEGIEAMAGSHVRWGPNGLVGVAAISHRYEMEPGIIADEGSAISMPQIDERTRVGFGRRGELWTSPYSQEECAGRVPYLRRLKSVGFVFGETMIAPRLWVKEGTAVAWTEDRTTIIAQHVSRPYSLQLTGDFQVNVAVGSSLHLTPWSVYVSRILRPLEFPDGRRAEAGMGVVLARESNGAIDWSGSRILSADSD